jgi:hypothetical protein
MTSQRPPTCARPKRYWFLTTPRSASNLIVKMLNLPSQAAIAYSDGSIPGGAGYFFAAADRLKRTAGVVGKPMREWPEETRNTIEASLQECFGKFDQWLKGVEEEKAESIRGIFVKEHVDLLLTPSTYDALFFGQETMPAFTIRSSPADRVPNAPRHPLDDTFLPFGFLETWYPTFLIRHPALMLPSGFRALSKLPESIFRDSVQADQLWRCGKSLRSTRRLYEWYDEHFRQQEQEARDRGDEDAMAVACKWPVILDAADMTNSPALVSLWCSQMDGMDSSKVRHTWDPLSPEDLEKRGPVGKVILESIDHSHGVIRSKSPLTIDLDLDTELATLKKEFGDKAAQLEEGIKETMVDYIWLWDRRLQLTD